MRSMINEILFETCKSKPYFCPAVLLVHTYQMCEDMINHYTVNRIPNARTMDRVGTKPLSKRVSTAELRNIQTLHRGLLSSILTEFR